MRFFANKFWFRFSKSGDVKLYGKRELEALFVHCGFQSVLAYRKGRGLFLKAWR